MPGIPLVIIIARLAVMFHLYGKRVGAGFTSIIRCGRSAVIAVAENNITFVIMVHALTEEAKVSMPTMDSWASWRSGLCSFKLQRLSYRWSEVTDTDIQ